jgi:acyl-CoA synthetase (AMP-forming)/AMP-acid ligase II
MRAWNFADIYEAVAVAVPERPALVHGEVVTSWRSLDGRAEALAADLLGAGLRRDSKVAAYLTNRPEYIETYMAAFKARLTPVNVNYRYGPSEIAHILRDADAEAVVFETTSAPLVDEVRGGLPLVRRWYAVRAGGATVPAWATDFEAVASAPRPTPVSRARDGDDQLLLYTGGTTGLPKGVVWRHDDLLRALGGGGNTLLGVEVPATPDELFARLAGVEPHGPVMLVTCPLMHGTGQFSALSTLTMAGTVVTLPSGHFDARDIWECASRHRVHAIVIVGQTFGGPMLDELLVNGARYDLTNLQLITSSGVMWSQDNKDALLELLPDVALLDNYGSSEAVGAGASLSRRGTARSTASFRLGKRSAVFTEDGRRVEPGSGERGLVAMTGPLPLGYYKDDEKTRATFRQFEGQRWSVLGDWAEVDGDGTIRLLGRGSSCINTGGEKVFPEEVEEALKTHPSVGDAIVVGVPSARFGEEVCAVVEAASGAGPVDAGALKTHVKERLASFKAPRHVVVVDRIDRAPNGKVDHRRMRELAVDRLGMGSDESGRQESR